MLRWFFEKYRTAIFQKSVLPDIKIPAKFIRQRFQSLLYLKDADYV